jgi:hypothetical protein
MPPRRTLIVLALASVTLLARPTAADACSCGQPKPCLALGTATVVFVGTVTHVEPIPRRENKGRMGFRRFRFDVERTFRNTTSRYRRDPASPRPVVELTAWGEGSGCIFGFEQGRRYLVFAREEQGFLIAGLCSGTLPIELSKDYLDYLERPPAKPDAGRVFGFVYLDTREQGSRITLPPIAVTLRGDRFTRNTMTKADGRFEFVDVPAERFTVTAVPPAPLVATRNVTQDSPDPRQCTHAALPLRYDGRISGIVRHSTGRPAPNLRVQAMRPAGYEAVGESTTDASGRYVLTALSPGKYEVGVNIGHPPTVQSPYGATAVGLSLSAGQRLDAPPLTLTRPLIAVEVRGCAVWPDKRPVVDGWVTVQGTREPIRGAQYENIELDQAGCFSLRAIEGNRYTLEVWAMIPPEWPVTTTTAQQTIVAVRDMAPLAFALKPPRPVTPVKRSRVPPPAPGASRR